MGGEAAFLTAYESLLRRWPDDVRSVDLPSRYGTTRVHVCGPEHGTPLVLLPGGGTTSAVWHAGIGALSRTHRVHAPDLMGDVGLSVHDGARLRATGDLTAWLDALLDALELERAQLCGYSYGAWIALNYALHAPHRISRLALLEPTNCFAGLSPGYLLRAIPLLLKRSPERARAFFRWGTGGLPEDPAWQRFLDAAASAPRSKVLAMRRPKEADLRACTVATLVLLAERSKAHDTRRVSAGIHRLMPHATVATLPGASHHGVPTERPAELNRLLAEFLD